MPLNPTVQQITFSIHKNHNTLKALIGITPSGAISFISNLYGRNIYVSDKKLVMESGFLKLLECGDTIMADQGFNNDDILPPDVLLNVSPMMNEAGQLTAKERTTTKRIASLRIYIEHAMERIKNYHLLHSIPNSMDNNVNQVYYTVFQIVCTIM